MKKRPTSVTVIAWILIVIGALSLVATLLTMNNPMTKDLMMRSPVPLPVQYIMMYVALAVSITSGIGMLKGFGWSRLLYVGWSVIAFSFSLATSPMKAALIPGIVLFAVVVFFLFRPAANEYFGKSEAASGA